MSPKLTHRLEYAGFLALCRVARRLGPAGRRRLGERLGRLAWWILPRRRELAAENVRRAFPDWGEPRVQALVRDNLKHLGRVVLEFAAIPSLTLEDVRSLGRLENAELLDAAQARGKGVLLLGGHLGNWEYGSLVMGAHGYAISAIAKRIANPLIDRHVTRLRTHFGGTIIGHRNAVRPVFKALRQGGRVGFLLDQRAVAREGVRSEFFGQPVSTNQGLALLALKSGAPVVFGETERVGDVHVVRFGPCIDPPDGLERGQAVAEFTRRFDAALEAAVRRRPEQWFWVHQRWKLPRELQG
ncbi:MAG: lysophospholipid acyltransferase family protein [Deferrisomatales bacterium]|nr:lysophospholipid acyltransferase family protein [Deferrisomatales bacterium]